MIFKIVGAVIVIITTITLGISKSREFENRVRYLENMQLCILQLENEIRYTQTPIFEALKRISETTQSIICKLFDNASKQGTTGETVSTIWTKAVEDISPELFNEDLELFLSLGECLGTTDLEGQIKGIELFKSKLNQQLQTAKDICNKNQKLYKNLGLYSGLLITVLLL